MGVTVGGHYEDEGGKLTFVDGPNFSNRNFRLIMEYLGLEAGEDCVGRLDAHDLKARCVTARAVGGTRPDRGMVTTTSGGPGTGQARMIDLGLREGYFADAVERIEDVADACIALEIAVTYA